LAAVLLLSAMVAAISLTFRGKKPGVLTIDPAAQMSVNRDLRLSMVNLKSERPMDLTREQGDAK
jgi:NADH-quinone oxidoreductase subunit J